MTQKARVKTNPMTANDYQLAAKAALEQHFADVRLEWSVVKDACDLFAADIWRYAPRVDVAVGPFNTTPGNDRSISDALLPAQLRDLLAGRSPNPNPRCLLAIEVIYSGTSKHIMGDMLNACALGLYGLVIGSDKQMLKIQRIETYIKALISAGKPSPHFDNLACLSTTDFDALLALAHRQ